MTPTEVTTTLRQFNEWRRGDEDIPQPDAKQITAAIDAAVEVIERMERELRLIAETDPIDAALDPHRAICIARDVLEKSK